MSYAGGRKTIQFKTENWFFVSAKRTCLFVCKCVHFSRMKNNNNIYKSNSDIKPGLRSEMTCAPVAQLFIQLFTDLTATYALISSNLCYTLDIKKSNHNNRLN